MSYRRKTRSRAVRGLGPSGAGVASRRVRRDLDLRANVAQLARRLAQRDVVPRVRERVSRCEAANVRADDYDVEWRMSRRPP